MNKLYFIATEKPSGGPDRPMSTQDDGSVSMFEDLEKAKAVLVKMTETGTFPPLFIYGVNSVMIGRIVTC